MIGSFAKYGYLAAFLVIVSYAFFTLRGPKGIPGLKHLSVFVKSETPSLRIVKRAKAWW